MFPRKFRLCELFGIPLYLDFSLAILLFFFVTGGGGLFAGLLGAAVLLVSITAHELGHALTARSFGYETNDITLSLPWVKHETATNATVASAKLTAGPAIAVQNSCFVLRGKAMSDAQPPSSDSVISFVS